MKINPHNHGNHNNLHASTKLFGYKFKLVLFFDTAEAHVMKSVKLKEIHDFNLDKVYDGLKSRLLNEMDFKLKTPKNKILNQRFETTKQLLNNLKIAS